MHPRLLHYRSCFSGTLLPAALLLLAPATAQPQSRGPCVDQSPRQVQFDMTRETPPAQGEDYNFSSTVPLAAIAPGEPKEITYQQHPLERCDRHYHIPVENTQLCPGERKLPPTSSGNKKEPGPPRPGDWVEMHTVYAAEVSTTGECATFGDHALRCCLKPPFVVLAFSAQVQDKDFVPPPAAVAEWFGSTTGEDDATGCKPTPAFWHFNLGCQATFTPAFLEHIGHPHSAREPQSPNRVSTDLTYLPPAGTPVNSPQTCRPIRTAPIADNAAADRICPGVCKSPLNQPLRINGHVKWEPKDGYALCTCCPLNRPQ